MVIENIIILSFTDKYGTFYAIGDSIANCQITIAESSENAENIKVVPFKDWENIDLLLEHSNQNSMSLLDYVQTITDYFPHVLEGD